MSAITPKLRLLLFVAVIVVATTVSLQLFNLVQIFSAATAPISLAVCAVNVNTLAAQVLQLLQSQFKTSSAVTAPASVTVLAVVTNVGALAVSACTTITSIDN